jgi:hypothetical protein
MCYHSFPDSDVITEQNFPAVVTNSINEYVPCLN